MLSLSYPLLLSTLAGLSTTIGGVLAVIKKPDQSSLALLLGIAIGVMATVSIVELVVKNAIENDPFLVLAASGLGALFIYVIDPLFPHFEIEETHKKHGHSLDTAKLLEEGQGRAQSYAGSKTSNSPDNSSSSAAVLRRDTGKTQHEEHNHQLQDHGLTELITDIEIANKVSTANLMRLGILMAVTMTLHNLPEGFAVAFSAYTDIGLVMTIAIAVHNIPEGIIVAAPIYAATGSRWKALGIATASGLSEPLGALLALLVLRPVITPERLNYILAFVGGIMLCVCAIDLWPEARNCRHDRHLMLGIFIGGLIMAWTLYAGA